MKKESEPLMPSQESTKEVQEKDQPDEVLQTSEQPKAEKIERPDDVEKTSKTSKVLSFIRKDLLPAMVEGGSRAVEIFNKGVDYAGEVVNNVVPGLGELTIDFVLPKNFARPIEKTIEYSTKATTFIAKGALKGALNIFTFGAPAWADAIRQHLAVKDSNEKYEKVDSGKDLLAVSFQEHLKDEKIKTALGEYYNARKELTDLRKQPEKNKERIAELSETIASYEINYKDCVDFSNLKAILEKGKEFADKNEALVAQLSEETAGNMIGNVEDFYKNKFGKLGGQVEGKWMGIITSPKKGREKLVAGIAERLNAVMIGELGKEETQKEMQAVNKELFSGFGVYRKYFKAAIFGMLRFLPIPQTPESGHQGAWEMIKEKIPDAFKKGYEAGKSGIESNDSYSGVAESFKSIASGTWRKITDLDSLKFLPSAKEYIDFVKNLYNDSVTNLLGVASHHTGEGIGQITKWATDGAKFVGNKIFENVVATPTEVAKNAIARPVVAIKSGLKNYCEEMGKAVLKNPYADPALVLP